MRQSSVPVSARVTLMALALHSGYGRIFHVFSGAQPKLELLRRLSSSAQADAADGTPALESTVACIPITGVAELAAQQVSAGLSAHPAFSITHHQRRSLVVAGLQSSRCRRHRHS